jgi:hypothetical protein
MLASYVLVKACSIHVQYIGVIPNAQPINGQEQT